MLEFLVLLVAVALAAAVRSLILGAWAWRTFCADAAFGLLLLVGVRLLTAFVGLIGGGA
jgi:hypothetical protein